MEDRDEGLDIKDVSGHLTYRNQTVCLFFPCWLIFPVRFVTALPVSGKASGRTHGVTRTAPRGFLLWIRSAEMAGRQS